LPVTVLTPEQQAQYGRYASEPSQGQLDRYFHLSDDDRSWILEKRGPYNRLGFGVQICTVRFLGTFLPDPTEVPALVLRYVAAQLDLPADTDLAPYRVRKTHWEHANEIKVAYGYRDFHDPTVSFRLIRWLYARAWLGNERPSVLFDLMTARLLEYKVLLPGVSTLTRLISKIRERVTQRLHDTLAKRLTPEETERLQALLSTPEGDHLTGLERLRRAPTRVSGPALVDAVGRVDKLRALRVSHIDTSSIPPVQVQALARYGLTAWAQTIRRMQPSRGAATLLVTVQELERRSMDDCLDLFDMLVHDLLNQSERTGKKERLRSLKDYDVAALCLANTMRAMLDPQLEHVEVGKALAERFDREALSGAIQRVVELARPPEDTYQEELLRKWPTARRFLPSLFQSVTFEATEAGQEALNAWHYLRDLWADGRRNVNQAPLTTVTPGWQRYVMQEDGTIGRKAFVFSTLHVLRNSLRRRDIFVRYSNRYADPTAKLLQGPEWEALKPQICRTLNLHADATKELASLSEQLDEAYRHTAKNLPLNPALRIERMKSKDVLVVSTPDKLDDPLSLRGLRARVERMLPRVDLPELLLEIHEKTGFANVFTHVNEQHAGIRDLATSVCAVLLAEACNIGLEALVDESEPSLTRARLSWTQQNYVRAETLSRANACLVDHHATLALAKRWGGGEVASVDGLRFMVPVRTLNAGPNPKYFGLSKGITYLNYTSDQFTGFHGLVIPGTLRDSLYILDGLLEQETNLEPVEVMSDTGAYSDLVFGLFWLLGYQFSPRLADVGNTRYWRIGKESDYGCLDGIARHRINTKLLVSNWDDLLRVAGSLRLGKVSASELMRTLQRGERPTTLTSAIGELGRIAKTRYLLAYIDDADYRRRVLTQLNRHEGRHRLARATFHGQRGEVRKRYREGQEDQISALGLVTNAIILWNTLYMDAALDHLQNAGMEILEDDVTRLSPLGYSHINFLGRFHFKLTESVKAGKLREWNLE
jgi:TnpA family transposase